MIAPFEVNWIFTVYVELLHYYFLNVKFCMKSLLCVQIKSL